MYCPSCGIDSVEGLKYCKRCGINLATSVVAPAAPKALPIALIIAFLVFIAGVFLAGLTMPFMITKELSARGFSQSDMMNVIILESCVTLAVVAMLVRLLFRLIGANHQTGSLRPPEIRRTDSPPPQIAPPDPVASVTENTTRSFDPRVYDKLSSQRSSPIES
jgi:hypothetical protein